MNRISDGRGRIPPLVTRPMASLSFDLDDKWTYLKTSGHAEWASLPTYFHRLVPRLLDLLRALNLRITVFVVGQDAALDRNRDLLRLIADAGHEIGNHSFHHNPWLHLYTEAELVRELSLAEVSIERVTGQRPVGFRGPGYTLSPTTLQILAQRGYVYDASTFPSFLNPIARAYFLRGARLCPFGTHVRSKMFGSFTDGFLPNRPFHWTFDNCTLMEIPTTTIPVVKVPFHFSYLLCLARYSSRLALCYFQAALCICRFTGTQPSLLLGPLDLLGSEDDPALASFPGMTIPLERKLSLLSSLLHLYGRHFTVLPILEYARAQQTERMVGAGTSLKALPEG